MIDPEEIRRWSRERGMSESQVRKDHLISHLLQTLEGVDGVVFFGGTALNRTFVHGRRLSEDIDLFQVPSEPVAPETILTFMRVGTQREYPDLRIEPTGSRGDVTSYGVTAESQIVQLQIVGSRSEHSRYVTSMGDVALWYSDLPVATVLRIPTLESFVAMKCAAYEDRHAPRDLFDLGSLADIGAINAAAVEALADFRGSRPTKWAYEPGTGPTAEQWRAELAHQTGEPGDPDVVLARVRTALGVACEWDS